MEVEGIKKGVFPIKFRRNASTLSGSTLLRVPSAFHSLPLSNMWRAVSNTFVHEQMIWPQFNWMYYYTAHLLGQSSDWRAGWPCDGG